MLGLGTAELVLAIAAHLVVLWIIRLIYTDAVEQEVSYPRFWTGFCAGAFVLGVYLFLFTDAPLTGIILTANTGFVLYGYERQVTREDDPGRDPDGPLGSE